LAPFGPGGPGSPGSKIIGGSTRAIKREKNKE